MLTVSSLCVLFAAAQSQIHSASDLLDGAIVEEKMKGGVLRSLRDNKRDKKHKNRKQGKEGKQTHKSCIEDEYSANDWTESNFAATLDKLAEGIKKPCDAEIEGIIERIKTDVMARARAGWKDIKYGVYELQEILPPYFYEFAHSEYARGANYLRFVRSGLEQKLNKLGLHVRFCSAFENAMIGSRGCHKGAEMSHYIRVLQICLNEKACTMPERKSRY